jgi:hypothetical protein
MNFGRRLQARLAVPGMPVTPALGDTFSGEIGLGEDLVLVESPEDDIMNDLRYWDEGGAFSIFGEDGFGVDLGEIQYLVKSGDDRINALTAAFGKASADWSIKDPGAFADFLNDLTALQMRWGTAKAAATGLGIGAMAGLTGGLTTGSPGQAAYDGLIKALKQGGNGAQVHKGDFDDLNQRLNKISGFSWSPSSQPGTPLSTSLLKLVTPLDTVGMVKGDIAPKGVFNNPEINFLRDLHDFWIKNEHMIVVGLSLVGGLMFAGAIVGLFKGAPVAAKYVAAKYLPLAAA